MPYLLQSNQNRVENIKKKFENSHCDRKDDSPSGNDKSFVTPSKTRVVLDLKGGNLVNERDSSDKHTVKSEVNKADGKAVVRRSPAFRREKLNFGKNVPKLGNPNEISSQERNRFHRTKLEQNKRSNDEAPSTVKLKNRNPPNCTEPIQFQFNRIQKSNSGENLVKNPTAFLKESKNDNSHNKISDNLIQCSVKSPPQKDTSNSKTGLKLTDSIRLALKAPLPKGPPPKKPPRTFVHTLEATNALINSQEGLTAKSEKDPVLRLKLEKIEKVVKSLDSRNQNNSLQESNKLEFRKPLPTVQSLTEVSDASQTIYGKPLDTFCLKSLNCINSETFEKPVMSEKEFPKQSSFYIDCPKDKIECDKTEIKNSHFIAKAPLFEFKLKKRDSEPIYDLPCITKRSSFESFGKGSKEAGSSVNMPQQLHYMCTDVVNSLQETSPIFSQLNQGHPAGGNFPVDTGEDNMKNIIHQNQKVKKSYKETTVSDRNFDNNGILNKTKIDKEEMKTIMNDVFNSLNPKWIRRKCKPPNADVDSDSESPSSGLEDHSGLIEDNKLSHSTKSPKNQTEGCMPVTTNRKDPATVQSAASRKTYVTRVSSKLLSHSPYLKNSTNDSFTHLFESCILVGLTLSDSKTTVPYIKSTFPSNVKPPPLIESLCFPDASTWSQSSYNLQQGEQYYSLVITNENGDRKFGYCRRVLPEGGNFCLPLVYCIISVHRANGFYYKVLQELESRHGSSELHTFIKQLYDCSFPGPGQSLKLKRILEEVTKVSPSNEYLPSTLVRRPCDVRLEERDLSQLLQHLKVSVFLKVFSSLLLERKVLILGHSLRNLSCSVEALQSLLIPFSWQHTFIPVLPNNLIEMCDAPTPYLIGVQKSAATSSFFQSLHFEDGIMVDLEESHIIKCCGDEESIIPHRLTKSLKTALNLALNASLESENDRNVVISEAFICFFVEICGSYLSFIVQQPDGRKIFQKEEFINSVPSIQSFLDWFVETAMFRSFIQERLQSDIEDLFKRRVMEHMDETEKPTALSSRSHRATNRKAKTLGDRLKDLTLFNKY